MNTEKLRKKLANDIEFATRFFSLTTEIRGLELGEVFEGPNLPFADDKDPGILIAYAKGQDSMRGKTVEIALFEEHEYPTIVEGAYLHLLWKRYDPVTDEDFEALPEVYGISFHADVADTTTPLFHVRMAVNGGMDDQIVTDTGDYLNLINKGADSEIMRLVRKASEDGGASDEADCI